MLLTVCTDQLVNFYNPGWFYDVSKYKTDISVHNSFYILHTDSTISHDCTVHVIFWNMCFILAEISVQWQFFYINNITQWRIQTGALPAHSPPLSHPPTQLVPKTKYPHFRVVLDEKSHYLPPRPHLENQRFAPATVSLNLNLWPLYILSKDLIT